MTLTDRAGPARIVVSPTATESSPVHAAGSAAVVIGLLAGAMYLQGTFYPVDAFGITVLALGLVAAGVVWNRDRHGLAVILATGGLAAWWMSGSIGSAHRPGSSPSAHRCSPSSPVSSYCGPSARPRSATRSALALAAVGAVVAASGLVGVLGRWTDLARPVDGSWHAASTLTDPAATAVVCGLAVLLALAADLRSPFVRLVLASSVAGLLATQGHWELLALGGVGALLVPRDRWTGASWPLACGVAGGIAVVATSAGPAAGAVGWAVGIGAPVLAALRVPSTGIHWTRRAGVAGVVVLAAVTTLAVLHVPSDARHTSLTSQTVAWSESGRHLAVRGRLRRQPPRVHTTGGPVADYPGLEPDTYLSTAVDGGAVAAVLLLAAGAAVAASIRRRDLLSSCAAGATVAFAVAGFVDAARPAARRRSARRVRRGVGRAAGKSPGHRSDPRRRPAPRGASGAALPGPGGGGLWTLVIVVVVVTQGLIGDARTAGGAARTGTREPPHATDLSAPAWQW